MLKKVIGAIRSWLQKYSITTTINKFDEKLDHTSWKGAEFYPNYFQPFALVPPSNYSSQGTYRQIKIDDKLGEVAANITEDFKDKLVSLLGDNVRLDDIYLFWYDPEKRTEWSLSNSWHDDNVGHRIKIFVCFEGNGTTPTVVIPNSFNKPYKMRNSEYKRFLGGRDVDAIQDEIKLAYKAGDIALFDTACLHRGLYEEPAAVRAVLVMEYIDRNKANIIAGKSPCGPGMSRTGKVIFEEGAYNSLKATGLMDDQLIKKVNNEYVYSLIHLNN